MKTWRALSKLLTGLLAVATVHAADNDPHLEKMVRARLRPTEVAGESPAQLERRADGRLAHPAPDRTRMPCLFGTTDGKKKIVACRLANKRACDARNGARYRYNTSCHDDTVSKYTTMSNSSPLQGACVGIVASPRGSGAKVRICADEIEPEELARPGHLLGSTVRLKVRIPVTSSACWRAIPWNIDVKRNPIAFLPGVTCKSAGLDRGKTFPVKLLPKVREVTSPESMRLYLERFEELARRTIVR